MKIGLRQKNLYGTDVQAIDQQLRSYMLRVYNYMAGGLAVSGGMAFLTISYLMSMEVSQIYAFYNSYLYIVIAFLPLGVILLMRFNANNFSASTMQMLYWLFVALNGVGLSSIFVVYEMGSIVKVFLITAGTFTVMSMYGYTTQKNLLSYGSYMLMALVGLLIAIIINFFLRSSAFDFLISIFGVLLFIGLTAYDTQRIKVSYLQNRGLPGVGEADITKSALFGALRIYLDFINLLLFLLRLFGKRR